MSVTIRCIGYTYTYNYSYAYLQYSTKMRGYCREVPTNEGLYYSTSIITFTCIFSKQINIQICFRERKKSQFYKRGFLLN